MHEAIELLISKLDAERVRLLSSGRDLTVFERIVFSHYATIKRALETDQCPSCGFPLQ